MERHPSISGSSSSTLDSGLFGFMGTKPTRIIKKSRYSTEKIINSQLHTKINELELITCLKGLLYLNKMYSSTLVVNTQHHHDHLFGRFA